MDRNMYDMKRVLRGSLSLLMAIFLCMACTDTEHLDNGITTIYIQLPETESRISPTYESELEALENEIHTLRVILLSQAGTDKSTTINRLFTNVQSGNSLTIENVPLGKAQLYVIANEASIGQDYSDIANLQQQVVDVNNSRKVLINDTEYSFFPKRGSELLGATQSEGLPMTWMNRDLDVTDNMQISVELERCVSKIRMQIKNNFSADIVVNEVSFGAFFGNSFYLFRETNLDVPSTAVYKEQVYDDLVNYPIQPNESEVLICYLYPSFAWTSDETVSPYTIGFKTEHGNYPRMEFLDSDGESYNSIPRNKQININVTLSGQTHVNVDFEVVDWENREIWVPDFQ